MACAAGLFFALLSALSQEVAGARFQCTLPEGYLAFTPVAGQPAAWESSSADKKARFQVQYFELETPGAQAELVARDLRSRLKASFGQLPGFALTEWKGDWGGLPAAAGHTLRYQREQLDMAAIDRIAIVHDQLVHLNWEGPASGLPQALTCAASFRVPDEWIPQPPPALDVHRGSAPGTEAQDFPWRLEVSVNLVAWSKSGVIEVRVRALPRSAGGALPEAAAWRLPNAALTLTTKPGEVEYRLDPLGAPENLAQWGIAVSAMSDLAACDAIWLAIPDPGAGNFLPPAWSLEATHAAHMVLVGPDGAKPVFDEVKEYSTTRFGAVPAGRSWPFFLAGRFEERLHAGIVWKLRKDAKTLTPDQPVAAISRLHAALRAWMPGLPARLGMASFPGIGDRILPGLIVLDENRDWFSQPMDAQLGGLSRRTWMARLVAASCFGVELRGSGNGAPVLENALAEYAAARLLEAADWKQDAEALRAWWAKSEAAAGPLPMPLTLLPVEDVLGSQRILTAGAQFWSQLEAELGRQRLDEILRQALAAGRPWSTRELTATSPQSAGRIEALLYTIPQQ